MSPRGSACWCGELRSEPFGPDYAACTACGTLRVRRLPARPGHGYGREYWTEVQLGAGRPDIAAKSRREPAERGLYWLDTLLGYCRPTGRVLEIGCGHGGFLALLREAGFEVAGVEASRWTAAWARDRFGVDVGVGRAALRRLPEAGFDAVVAMDVLEHVADPLGELGEWTRLLAPHGVLLLQTPCRPRGLSWEALREAAHPFATMLLPEEHLHLLETQGLRRLLDRVGFAHTAFEPALFPYDMLVAAARMPLPPRELGAETELEATPRGRLLLPHLLAAREHRATERALQASLERERRSAAELERAGERIREAESAASQAEFARSELIRHSREAAARDESQAEAARNESLSRSRASAAREERHRTWEQRARRLLEELRRRRPFRALVRLGRWRAIDQEAARLLAEAPGGSDAGAPGHRLCWSFAPPGPAPAPGPPRGIAVDLRPLRPGGRNGGASIAALNLVRELRRLEPQRAMLLLTTPACHDELATFESEACSRMRVSPGVDLLAGPLLARGIGLLLAPLGGGEPVDPRLRRITTVHDLLHRRFPAFLDPEEVEERERAALLATRGSEHLIAPSRSVARQIVEELCVPAERVSAIHHGLGRRLPRLEQGEGRDRLARLGLQPGTFLLYPANFWPHKNHRALLTAFGIARQRRPADPLRLVLTGASEPDPAPLREAARRMGLEDAVLFPGYVDEPTLAALLDGCAALLFASLHEGFGIPLHEALVHGRPVLASDLEVLREVAGDAPLFFDPRRPAEMAAAIRRLRDEPGLSEALGAASRRRAAAIPGPEAAAAEHLRLIDAVLDAPPLDAERAGGLYVDGWTAPDFAVGWAAASAPRSLELRLAAPQAAAAVELVARGPAGDERRTTLGPEPSEIHCELPAEAGSLVFEVTPPSTPGGSDTRPLGVRLSRCQLHSAAGSIRDLLADPGAAPAARRRPRFGAVTPSRDQARFLERTLRSIAAQVEVELDHVVVDGASRDGTLELLQRWGDRVRWVSEPDAGQGDAINRGLASVSGDVLGWLNSDDCWTPGALDAVAGFFARNPGVDVVYGEGELIDAEDRPLGRYATEPWDPVRLEQHCFLCQPASFVRRAAFERFGPLDASLRYCMDYEYWLRLARGGARFAHLPQVVARARVHPEAKSTADRRAVHREINDMLRRRLGRVPDRWLANWAHSRLEHWDRARHPRRFAVAVAALTWLAALRWNGGLSRELRRTTAGWVAGRPIAPRERPA